MTASSLLIVLASLFTSVSSDKVGLAPPEAKKATYLISARAHAVIDPLDAQTLADDEAFIKTLSGVLKNPDLTDSDKADAFFLKRMKFDWAFIGAASIPRASRTTGCSECTSRRTVRTTRRWAMGTM